ncbi:hypothetical protein B0T39_14815, partial [Chromobacterium haemolyticum]
MGRTGVRPVLGPGGAPPPGESEDSGYKHDEHHSQRNRRSPAQAPHRGLGRRDRLPCTVDLRAGVGPGP